MEKEMPDHDDVPSSASNAARRPILHIGDPRSVFVWVPSILRLALALSLGLGVLLSENGAWARDPGSVGPDRDAKIPHESKADMRRAAVKRDVFSEVDDESAGVPSMTAARF